MRRFGRLRPGGVHSIYVGQPRQVAARRHAPGRDPRLAPAHRAPLRTAYVEAVATDPARQRQGFASAVLERLVREVAGFELAALCPSDEGQLLYPRLGWETWIGPLSIRDGSSLIDTADESIMIHRLPLTPPLRLSDPMSAEWRPGELW